MNYNLESSKSMAWWWQLMPFFIVRFLAKKYCERLRIGSSVYTQPFHDVLILVQRYSYINEA